jgi:hypothetical protein
VGVPAHPDGHMPGDHAGGFAGSHLINLDTAPEAPGGFPRGRVNAHQQRMLTAQGQVQGQDWAQNVNAAGVKAGALPNSGPTLDDLAERMAGMNMANKSAPPYPQMNTKRLPPNMAGMGMMNPNLAAQMMQQAQPLPPPPQRTGPSKLSMMTNQQLMILAQTDMPLSKGYKTVLCKFWDHNMCAKVPAHPLKSLATRCFCLCAVLLPALRQPSASWHACVHAP